MRYEEKMMQPFYKIGKWIASKMVKKEDVKYQKLEQTLQKMYVCTSCLRSGKVERA